jgi:uncharacterized membrane protein
MWHSRTVLSAIILLGLSGPPTAGFATSLPSFQCTFTEPFITILTSPRGIIYEAPDANQSLLATSVDTGSPTTIVKATLADRSTFSLDISKEPGSDGMSEFAFPYTGKLASSAFGMVITGGCLKHANGTSPRRIINVAEVDRLNVRAGPNARARIVNPLRAQSKIWAYPQNPASGWVRVSSVLYPPNESGTVRVIEGWVNGRFLGPAIGQ